MNTEFCSADDRWAATGTSKDGCHVSDLKTVAAVHHTVTPNNFSTIYSSVSHSKKLCDMEMFASTMSRQEEQLINVDFSYGRPTSSRNAYLATGPFEKYSTSFDLQNRGDFTLLPQMS